MAGLYDRPSPRDCELDRVSGRRVQLREHAPFLRPAGRVALGAHQVQGQGLGRHLIEGCQFVGKLITQRAEHQVGVL
jgi:hypothetical protein